MRQLKNEAKKEKKEAIGEQAQIWSKPKSGGRQFTNAESTSERIMPEITAKKDKQDLDEQLSTKVETTGDSGVGEDAKKIAGKQGNGQQNTLHPKAQEMLDAINKNTAAKKALQRLVEEGCDQSVVLTNLFYYCGGTAEDRRLGLKAALNFRDRFEWLATRLLEDAKWVEEIQEKCRKYGTAIHGPGFEDLSATLMSFAEMLTDLGKSYRAGLKNVRPGDAQRMRRNSREPQRQNPTAGRTQHLVYLAYYIKGENELPVAKHYRLLAELVAAVQTEDKRPVPQIADGLRKAVAAFSQRRPRDTKVMAEEAGIEFDEKNPKPQNPTRN
jgi:hypothetical protein